MNNEIGISNRTMNFLELCFHLTLEISLIYFLGYHFQLECKTTVFYPTEGNIFYPIVFINY